MIKCVLDLQVLIKLEFLALELCKYLSRMNVLQ